MDERLLSEVMATVVGALVLGLVLGAGAASLFGASGWYVILGISAIMVPRAVIDWRKSRG